MCCQTRLLVRDFHTREFFDIVQYRRVVVLAFTPGHQRAKYLLEVCSDL